METWSQEQQIKYEFARDTISSLSALLSRYSYWLEILDKNNTTIEKNYIERINKRAIELSKEIRLFNGFDEEIIQEIIKKYSPLIKKYNDSFNSDEAAAKEGLDEQYLTTKVIYNEQ